MSSIIFHCSHCVLEVFVLTKYQFPHLFTENRVLIHFFHFKSTGNSIIDTNITDRVTETETLCTPQQNVADWW
jgi:hypothetical protein